MRIICRGSWMESGRKLSKATGFEIGPSRTDTKMVRWGCIQPVPKKGVTYNTMNAINLASDKARCRELFARAGVPTPESVDIDDAKAIEYPVVGRPQFHSRGNGIFVCNNHRQLMEAWSNGARYFSKLFNKTHEFRVHCGNGKVLFVQQKSEIEGSGRMSRIIRLANQWWWIIYRSEWQKDILMAALGAVDAIGLDFGGVDVMWNSKTKQACVCEVNTAPGLDGPMSVGHYARYFKWLNSHEGRAPHWDFRSFRNTDSLGWQKFQLEPGFVIPKEKRKK